MKIFAYNTRTGKQYDAWTTDREPDVALTIIVPCYTKRGVRFNREIAIGRTTLLAAAQTGALEEKK
jgi:hypothetical protein